MSESGWFRDDDKATPAGPGPAPRPDGQQDGQQDRADTAPDLYGSAQPPGPPTTTFGAAPSPTPMPTPYASPPTPPAPQPSMAPQRLAVPKLPRVRPFRWGRRLVALLAALITAYLVFYVCLGVWATRRLDDLDVLNNYSGRPSGAPGQTWLFVGSDSREGLSAAERKRLKTGGEFGAARTDSILILHVPRGGDPTLVSLPRDSYVTIPEHESNGRTAAEAKGKINSAFAFGGPELLVRTVELATGMRIDHYAEVGFAGIVEVTDAVGGVTIDVQRNMNDPKAGINLKKGRQVLTGQQSLGYVRARYSDPRGDLGRVERQQRFVAALMAKVATKSTVLNPFKATEITRAGTDALKVDDRTGPVDLLQVGRALKKISSGKGTTTTVPISNPNYRADNQSTVLWDAKKAAAFFQALRDGETPAAVKS